MACMLTETERASAASARYRVSEHDSIRGVDWDDWNRLRDPKLDPYMDPRYILAVENSMAKDSQFRHVLFYDAAGNPVASACLCAFSIDGAMLAEGRARTVANVINRMAPWLLRLPLMLCGLPVSTGSSHLRFALGANRSVILQGLDQILGDFAKSTRCRCIVFKEFEDEQSRELAPLESLGYRKADSLPMNCTPVGFDSFHDYLSRVKSSRRRTIRQSREKFLASGMKVVNLLGGEGAEALFTDDVYQLYGAVLDRAAVRFERLPAEFFREIARQLPENSLFTYIYDRDRIAAFAVTLLCEEFCDQMFIGLDYGLNARCDLYFNLFFETLDPVFARRPSRVFVGQTSDDFKHQKLSAFQLPLSLYVKGCNRLADTLLAKCFDLFFPPRPMKFPGPGPSVVVAE
jgi:predicted N-acyltransferase